MTKTVYDLSSICESIYTGKNVVLEAEDEKKDDETSDNPFADTKEDDTSDSSGDTTEDSTEDSTESDDTAETDDTGAADDAETDDAATDETSTNDETFGGDEGTDDSSEDVIGTGDSVSGEEYSDVMNFGITILMLATQVHFWHINCRTGFEHQTLEELYYALTSLGDSLLESIVSVTKQSVLAGNELSFDFGNLEFDREEGIGILEDIRDEANSHVSRFSDDQGLCNILGDIAEKLGTAIYKLTKFE